ncbi:hypothetical protein M413DRAFT_154518 [Hebeloma cylindrosporum]|uniref:Uncharacterized protein n=1 Tax=Hebeloma cylindrosporum TaxID=76867 RepID=A0A0C3BW57_HEBCY|nr:hypothetical protein M413DRAFT_154518 [Hebeloma cylindrosporum h7]
MASPSSSTSVLDPDSAFKHRYPARPTRAPSVESLHFAALSNSSSGAAVHPNVLKKRHSTYTLSNSSSGSGIDRAPSLPPLPDMPPTAPLRPPRNPARPVSHMPPPPQRKKPRSRPSTADNNNSTDRAEVTPWEFQSLKEEAEGENPPSQSTAKSPSVRSRSSSAALGKSTGPVEVVTPWEVQSLEEEVVEIEKVYEPKPQATTSGAPVATFTGPVEDVTPWELHPLPAMHPQRAPSAFSNTTGRVARSSSSLHLHSNLSSSNISHNSPSSQSHQVSSLSNPPTPLTNVFGNTSLPPNGGRPHSNSTSSAGSYTGSNHIQYANVTSQPLRTPSYPRSTYSSSFGQTGTGPVEDVTPWELQPGPDVPSSPPPKSATSSNFTPARRSTSRPSSAKGQSSGPPSRPSSAKGLYGGTGFLTGIERAMHSGGVSAVSKSSSSQSLASLSLSGGLGKPNSYGGGTGGKV